MHFACMQKDLRAPQKRGTVSIFFYFSWGLRLADTNASNAAETLSPSASRLRQQFQQQQKIMSIETRLPRGERRERD